MRCQQLKGAKNAAPAPDTLLRYTGGRCALTLVTNDRAIAFALETAESVRTHFLGGLVRRNNHCTMVHGAAGREHARPQPGREYEAADAVAARVIMLFDAGKLGRTSFACFAPLETIDTIVTDAVGAEERHGSRSAPSACSTGDN